MNEIRKDQDNWSSVIKKVSVSGDAKDARYSSFPYSSILSHYRIAHAGILTTAHPYELTRIHQNGSCMIATLEGEGEVFIDGHWINLPKGHAALLPPFAYNSIRSIENKTWTFTWVKYLEEAHSKPIITAFSQVHGAFNAAALSHAITGLHQNMVSHKDKGAETLWVELIQKHVLLFSQPRVKDPRLWALWKEVQKNLGYKWTAVELAQKANISTEHLRRLCVQYFGRTTKNQLESLRMRKARVLLSDKQNKIEAIASQLGYYDTASFSNAFKKHMGFRPSEMR